MGVIASPAGTTGGRRPRETIMSVDFVHHPHEWIAARKKAGPAKTSAEHVGPNGRIALVLTTAVGTMWCAYAFALLALIALPQALGEGLFPTIQWVSQTFIQLVMLSVIMVGQNILSRASDKRADETYQDAEATLHEAQQIQDHLKAQDEAIGTLLDKIARLEAARGQA
jgi:predicted DNA repair protein MutK